MKIYSILKPKLNPFFLEPCQRTIERGCSHQVALTSRLRWTSTSDFPVFPAAWLSSVETLSIFASKLSTC